MSKVSRETWVPLGMVITLIIGAYYVFTDRAVLQAAVHTNATAVSAAVDVAAKVSAAQAEDLDELRVELRNEIAGIADQVQWIRDAVIRIEAALGTRPRPLIGGGP